MALLVFMSNLFELPTVFLLVGEPSNGRSALREDERNLRLLSMFPIIYSFVLRRSEPKPISFRFLVLLHKKLCLHRQPMFALFELKALSDDL